MSGKVGFEQQHTIVLMVPGRFRVAPRCGLIFCRDYSIERRGDGEDNLLTCREQPQNLYKSFNRRKRARQFVNHFPSSRLSSYCNLVMEKLRFSFQHCFYATTIFFVILFLHYFLIFEMRIIPVAYKR